MGRRDDELTPAALAEAEAATRRILARWDEPQPVAPPPGLARQVLATLPDSPRQARSSAPLPTIGRWALALGAALLLALGGWGVWLDSAGPAGLLGTLGAGLAGLALQLTLMAKPLINLLGASAGMGLAALAALIVGGAIWWRMVSAIMPATLEQAV
jgi:hypothetical protein